MSDKSELLTTREHTEAHGEKITGYRKLSEDEIALVNQIKAHGEATDALLSHIETYGSQAGGHGIDGRMLSIARTHLQTGQMFAVRAVAKPEGF